MSLAIVVEERGWKFSRANFQENGERFSFSLGKYMAKA
jgi:hypothetical protein